MTKNYVLAITLFTLGIAAGFLANQVTVADTKPPVKLETLMRSDLEVANGLEIIISRVEIGPNLSLPKHYHPGEEFIYALEGSASVWQLDKPQLVLNPGDVYKIPMEQVHTAITAEQPVTAIVFRVHRKGEPERIPVE